MGTKIGNFLKRHWMLVVGIAVAIGVAVGLGLAIKKTGPDTNGKDKPDKTGGE